jgi:tryptophan-rich sensory protein
MNHQWLLYLRGIIFGLAIFVSGRITDGFCAPLSTETTIPRPPGWVFGLAWSILYVTTGVAWALLPLTPSLNVGMAVLTTMLCAWLFVYSCAKAKVFGAVVLIASTVLTLSLLILAIMMRKRTKTLSGYWLIPLAGWLAYASYLNVAEVTQSSSATITTA